MKKSELNEMKRIMTEGYINDRVWIESAAHTKLSENELKDIGKKFEDVICDVSKKYKKLKIDAIEIKLK